MGNDGGGLRGRELGDIGLRGGAPLAECWIGGKWEDGGLMLLFCGEREEREEGERERSETGRRLYCCMEEALGTGRIGKCVEWREVIYVERDLYLRSLVIFWASSENG
jgi:hypothetical protein